MIHTNIIKKAAGAINTNGLHTDTNGTDFLTAVDQGKAFATQTDFDLTTTTTEARIDSRLLAKHLGNKHRHVMALLDKYEDKFKRISHVSFKNADGERWQGGGKTERYALLTEDQAYLLLNMSRNSEIVVDLKVKLIQVFSDYRRAADMCRAEYLPIYHALQDAIHALSQTSEPL